MPEGKKNLIPRTVARAIVREQYFWSCSGVLYGLFCLSLGHSFGLSLVIASCFLYRRAWRGEHLKLTRENRYAQFGDDPEDWDELHFPFCAKCRVEHEQGRHF
jgi:hypothetical protein